MKLEPWMLWPFTIGIIAGLVIAIFVVGRASREAVGRGLGY